MNLSALIAAYQTDPDSTFHKKRYAVRVGQATLMRRIGEKHGTVELSEIKGRLLRAWHKDWSGDGEKLSYGHAFIGQLRTMLGFGFTMLEDPDCERLCGVLHTLRFPMGKPRTERLTSDQADAIRREAHKRGWWSIALAQAFQFEVLLRQKDCLGEYVPLSEPGISDVIYRQEKWITGMRWSEIDENMILRHVTSKRQKVIEADLKLCPMVMEELQHATRTPDGPVILCEVAGLPWSAAEFRRKWRILADAAGIPRSVRNMDSRSGGITESFEAGVRPDAIQLTATHSDLSMTQRYHRSSHLETRSEAQVQRVEFRKQQGR